MAFRIGQRVVCIRGTGARVPYGDKVVICPEKGTTYTVRGIQPNPFTGGLQCLLLEEIHNPLHSSGLEFDFTADRFRPIVERKTDIGFAHEILRKVSRKYGADA